MGKTTTAINLAAGLATHKQRVLLVDLDPQGNATMGSGIDKNSLASNLYQVLIGEATIAQARVRSESGGYDVLPANRELSGAEIDLVQMDERERQLKAAIDSVKHEYDFVLIDCPPTLSLLTLNGLAAAASSFPCSANTSRSKGCPTWSIPSSACTGTSTTTCA